MLYFLAPSNRNYSAQLQIGIDDTFRFSFEAERNNFYYSGTESGRGRVEMGASVHSITPKLGLPILNDKFKMINDSKHTIQRLSI